MRLFKFSKPVQPRRRRKKKSHKWIDKAKAEVKQMPSLDNMEEDILVKAAILSAAGHYSLKLTDFKWSTPEDAAFVQNIIWATEALQKRYPRYLQYARWVVVKQGIDIIEGKRKGYRKKEDPDHMFISPGVAPPPNMGRLMQEEWDRHFTRPYEARRVARAEDELARFLRGFNDMLKTAINSNQSQDKMAKTIAVDIDGNGTFIKMTPDEYAMWKTQTKRQQPDN